MGRSSFYSPNEKITLEILDSNTFLADENLGSYTLDIVGFVKQNDDGIFENGVFSELGEDSASQWRWHAAKFFSTSLILEDKFVFSQATVDERLLYILISWRRPDNAFKFSYGGLARFFKILFWNSGKLSRKVRNDGLALRFMTWRTPYATSSCRDSTSIYLINSSNKCHYGYIHYTQNHYHPYYSPLLDIPDNLDDKIAAFYGFQSITAFTERKCFKSGHVKKVHYGSHSVAQINQDAQLEKEIFESVIERYQVDKEADDSFIKEQENKTKFTEAEN
ncbi:3756_t:CDS:2 [Paraglomus brasilianum]|uniref:3756_t:CDS:1 n=1 Tax=Paraglomus brasilianum TaxID=144538 RepID=A0A9N9CW56_9GLOM|nr:3756_t:CDS:2 [Paraglomus brasilianum]